jgi:hypothetical protein
MEATWKVDTRITPVGIGQVMEAGGSYHLMTTYYMEAGGR